MSCWYNNYEKLYLLEAVMSIESVTHVDNVKLSEDGRAVVIIDQSLLPNETCLLYTSRCV